MDLKLKVFRGFIIITFFLLVVFVGYKNILPTALEKDIHVEATIRLNDTDNCDYKEYVLETNITKDKNCPVIIYPYIDGLGMMTYSREEEGYVVLSSIGSDGFTEPIAKKVLSDLLYISEDISLIGFWVPNELGQYKVRTYFDKLDEFAGLNNPVLICVFYEEKFGKQLSWTKTIPVTIE